MAHDDTERWPARPDKPGADHLIAEARRVADDIRRSAERDASAIRREAAEWAASTRREAERHRDELLAATEAPAPEPPPPEPPPPEPAPAEPPASEPGPVGAAPVLGAAPTTGEAPPSGQGDDGAPRRRWALVALAVALVAVGALGGALLSPDRETVSGASVPGTSALVPVSTEVGDRARAAVVEGLRGAGDLVSARHVPVTTTTTTTTTAPAVVAMPDVVGRSLEDALAVLHAVGLAVSDVCCHSHGPVTDQRPPAGTHLAPGSAVGLRRGP